MKKFFRRIIAAALLSAVIIVSVSCGKNENSSAGSSGIDLSSYPVTGAENTMLTYWGILNSNISSIYSNFGDSPMAEELEQQTGIKVEYQHPPAGQSQEQFNLLLASGDLPDIIETDWYNFPGGAQKAINDGYIMPLNDFMDSYAMDLKKVLNDNPEADKMVKTDEGNYYVFPQLRLDSELLVYAGLMMREDWLKELNLEIPQTVDEWHVVLTAFKDKKGASAPLSFVNATASSSNVFTGWFGVGNSFYMEDGKIKYGPIEAGYKEFLSTFNQWYTEGLIDSNLANVDNKTLDANILTGKTGACYSFAGSGLGKWIGAMKNENPDFNITAVPYPVLKKGDRPQFGQKDLFYFGTGAAITKKSENAELAAKFLNFGYTEAGHMVYNFGVENESYTMVDGEPIYTDEILANSEGLSFGQALAKYAKASYYGPFVQDKRYIEQYYSMPQQQQAIAYWSETDAEKHKMPFIAHSSEESTEIANIMNEIETYVDEMYYKFIFGVESVDKFDEYVNHIKDLGIERVIELKGEALKRYQER